MIKYAHTNIIAQDWRKLVDFYCEVFDCVPVPPQRDQSGEWLSRGTGVPDAALAGMHLRLPGHGEDGPTLEIYSYAKMLDKPQAAANRKGIGHLAFLVDDVATIRAAVLAQGGADLGEIVQRDVAGVGRITFIYMADPEGNILEIQHWD